MAERFTGLLRPNRGVPGVTAPTRGRLPRIGGEASFAGPSPKLGHVLDANTVALWRFDELVASTNAVDLTGNYTLNQYGNPTHAVGQVDGGRFLDGSTMFFQRQGDLALGTALNGDSSIEFWVKVSNTTGGAVLFVYNGLNFTVYPADVILAEVGIDNAGLIHVRQWQDMITNSTMYATGPISFNTWHHIAVTRQRYFPYWFTKLFIDGVLNTTGYLWGPVVPVLGDFHYIGVGNYTTNAGLGNGNGLLTGVVDDTRISNVVRTPGEVLYSYQRGLGG